MAQTVGGRCVSWRSNLNSCSLDEPTNHLDLEGILWLETLLKKTNLALRDGQP